MGQLLGVVFLWQADSLGKTYPPSLSPHTEHKHHLTQGQGSNQWCNELVSTVQWLSYTHSDTCNGQNWYVGQFLNTMQHIPEHTGECLVRLYCDHSVEGRGDQSAIVQQLNRQCRASVENQECDITAND